MAELRPPPASVHEPVGYPLLPTGLRKFDLGTIPASVTPPRTWRRAAWFAVGTAATVVLALSYATITLVGNPRKNTTIDALPGQPTQRLLITDRPADPITTITTTAPLSIGRSPHPAPTRLASTSPEPRIASTHVTSRADTPEPPRDTPQQPVPAPPADPRPTTTTPPRVTVAVTLLALTDAQILGDRTEQYYAHVLRDPAAAHRLTAWALWAQGRGGIEARYADVARLDILKIAIDPSRSTTHSTLAITRRDGSTATVQRQLTFTTGSDPKITSDSEPA